MRTAGIVLAALSLSCVACVHDKAPVDPERAAVRARPLSARRLIAKPAAARSDAEMQAEVRAELRTRRRRHLDVLRAYREAGVFPINYSVRGDGHFLIDPSGALCAVANLIAMDGHRDLIEQASQIDNSLLFARVEDGPFLEWMLTSGFTQEEIARIQAPAPYVGEMPDRPLDELPAPVVAANEQTRAYLAAIEEALRADEEAGLELAASRLERRHDSWLAMAAPPRRYSVPPPAPHFDPAGRR